MTVSLSQMPTMGGSLCVPVSGATGPTVEVLIIGDGMGRLETIPLYGGNGFRCFRLGKSFGDSALIKIRDGAGNSISTTTSIQ